MSAKGEEWKKHKYVSKHLGKGGRIIYVYDEPAKGSEADSHRFAASKEEKDSKQYQTMAKEAKANAKKYKNNHDAYDSYQFWKERSESWKRSGKSMESHSENDKRMQSSAYGAKQRKEKAAKDVSNPTQRKEQLVQHGRKYVKKHTKK